MPCKIPYNLANCHSGEQNRRYFVSFGNPSQRERKESAREEDERQFPVSGGIGAIACSPDSAFLSIVKAIVYICRTYTRPGSCVSWD
jgi:hypothetical protein